MWIARIIRMSGVCLLMCIGTLLGAILLGKMQTEASVVAYLWNKNDSFGFAFVDVWRGVRISTPLLFSPSPDFAWSADGSYLLYTGTFSDNESYTIAIQKLTRHTLRESSFIQNPQRTVGMSPAISVTGNIAYAQYDYSNYRNEWFIIIHAANKPENPLSIALNAHARMLKWSPDGSQLAYLLGDDISSMSLWITDADGTHARLLLDGSFISCCHYDWSPDSAYITFTPKISNNQVYMVHVASGELTNLSQNTFYEVLPKWSPQGNQIAFVSVRTDYSQLFLMDVATGDVRQLTYLDRHVQDFSWSPDGKWLTFVATRPLMGSEAEWSTLYLISAEGGEIRQIIFDRYTAFAPQWKPQ